MSTDDKNPEKAKEQLSLSLEAASKREPTEASEKKTEGETLEWVCHPAKKNRRVTAAVSFFIAIVVVVVYFATDQSVLFSVLAFLVMTGSLASFYFPTRYKLTEDEIVVKTKMQTLVKKWSQYRTFYADKNGVLLSPFVRRSRLENFRGIYIKFWYNKDEVVAFVKERIETAKHEVEAG
jgi:hypothetical protein